MTRKEAFVWTALMLATGPLPALAGKAPTIIPASSPSVPPAVSDAQERRAIPAIKPIKIILVGDSTTQVGTGWGGAFCADRVDGLVACVNLARGGRSTYSYRAEGSWDSAIAEAKTQGYRAVFVLIQFGHNDQPGKPGNSTDLETEYPDNLRHYVKDVRAAGATAILVTPLTRRDFVDGSLQDTLAPWADKVSAVASELDVALVDLHAMSVSAVQALGPVDSLYFSQATPSEQILSGAKAGTSLGAFKPGTPIAAKGEAAVTSAPAVPKFDYTHLGPKGAAFFSHQVEEGLLKVAPELDGFVKP